MQGNVPSMPSEKEIDLTRNVRTVFGVSVRGLEYISLSDCRCQTSYTITGEIMIDGVWRVTRWTKEGYNISGNPGWVLINDRDV